MYLEFRLVDLQDGGEPWAVIISRYAHVTNEYVLLVARDGHDKYINVSEETYKAVYGNDNPPRAFVLVDDEVTLDIWDKTHRRTQWKRRGPIADRCENCSYGYVAHVDGFCPQREE